MGVRIAPAMVATSSEVQTADMRRRMAEAWGLAPLDFYGTTERPPGRRRRPQRGQAQAGAERRQRAVTRFTSLGGTTTTRAT